MKALFLFNGSDAAGRSVSLRIESGVITEPHALAGDLRIDLRGDRLLPGLINAHDHLQLNALPRLKFRDNYSSAGQWISDIQPRLQSDPLMLAYRGVAREQRLLIGGLKNLLSGVTTVAHHDALYPGLSTADFPVRVLQHYGWSHSLGLDGEAAVQAAHHTTPPEQPWIIHAAEGIDEEAAAEFGRLEALGCITSNTVLVHGVALSAAEQQRLIEAGAGLVWCPSSNRHLFARTADVSALLKAGCVALGSDSRISGGLDLLAELRAAGDLAEEVLESLVTNRAAALLRLPDRGHLRPGALADVLILPRGQKLSQTQRADVRLVLIGGQPRYADPDYAEVFGPAAQLQPVKLDGHRKMLAKSLVTALRASPLNEAGLDL